MSAMRSVAAASAAATLAACAGAFPAAAAGASAVPTAPGMRVSPAAIPVTAQAAGATAVRWVCHGPAEVFDTPGGIVIGILARGDRVTVLLQAAGRAEWVFVHGPIDIRGWMREGTLC